MKNKLIILYCCVLLISCGTTGKIELYKYATSKEVLERELRYVIEKNSIHSIPSKWVEIYQNQGSIEYWYVYFPSSPEEMYKISFPNIDEGKMSNHCYLALIGSFNGDEWRFRKELSSNELTRIKRRFENEILDQLGYEYSKTIFIFI